MAEYWMQKSEVRFQTGLDPPRAEQTHGKCKDGPKETQHSLNGNAHYTEGQQDQPNEGVEDERQKG